MTNRIRPLTQSESEVLEKFRHTSVSGRPSRERNALLGALKNLVEICGEANIPMVNSHAVRKMGKFLDAIEHAKKVINDVEG